MLHFTLTFQRMQTKWQARRSTCVWPNVTHFVLWMRFIRVNPVNLQKWPMACLLIMLVQGCDISTLVGPWPSNTSQHSPVASQPKIDQLILLGVASTRSVLLSPLKRQRVRTKSLLLNGMCSWFKRGRGHGYNNRRGTIFHSFPIKRSVYDTV
jgi:hypothetical protein